MKTFLLKYFQTFENFPLKDHQISNFPFLLKFSQLVWKLSLDSFPKVLKLSWKSFSNFENFPFQDFQIHETYPFWNIFQTFENFPLKGYQISNFPFLSNLAKFYEKCQILKTFHLKLSKLQKLSIKRFSNFKLSFIWSNFAKFYKHFPLEYFSTLDSFQTLESFSLYFNFPFQDFQISWKVYFLNIFHTFENFQIPFKNFQKFAKLSIKRFSNFQLSFILSNFRKPFLDHMAFYNLEYFLLKYLQNLKTLALVKI